VSEKNQVQSQKTSTPESTGTDYYLHMLKQMEDNYSAKISNLEEENTKLSQENVDLGAKIDFVLTEKGELTKKIKDYQKHEEIELKLRNKGEDTFEGALREQFSSMKVAFEDKIKQLNESLLTTKKEKGREIIDIKNQLTREKENRELLLRKLQIYTRS